MNAPMPLLALKGVSKRFGAVQALDGVDFDIYPGEVVALVGDNGAGTQDEVVAAITGAHLRPDAVSGQGDRA